MSLVRLSRFPEEERIARTEMLAELYYVESDVRVYPISETLLERALELFEYVDTYGKTYSIDRLQKMEDIRRRLGLPQ